MLLPHSANQRQYAPIIRASALLLLLLGGWTAIATADTASAFRSALDSIRAGQLQRHVDVLADDTFEGREAGSRGGHAAGVYLTEAFETSGLAPAGDGNSYFQRFGAEYRNILGVLEGSDPELKHEYIVVGAHYDHVGYGSAQNSFGPVGYIHNGADDNASGTAALLEAARAFGRLEPRPKRSILFALWDGEEKGLLGSRHWVNQPTVPLNRVRAMVNLDMVGRLRGNRVEVAGSRTASGFRELVSRNNQDVNLLIDFTWEIKDNSDHHSFFERSIPFLMLHTGLHDDYHRPSDDAHKVNADGIQQVTRLMFGIAYELSNSDRLPSFRVESRHETPAQQRRLARPLPPRPGRLGIAWDPAAGPHGEIVIKQVVPGSAADAAGLQPNDRLIEFDGQPIGAHDDFRQWVMSADPEVTARIVRPGEEEPIELALQLTGKPLRLGISWRTDDAEPGCVIVNRVEPASPADRAGVQTNDRIFAVDGQRFRDSETFTELVTGHAVALRFDIEREGQIVECELDLSRTHRQTPPVTVLKEPVGDEAEPLESTLVP